MGHHPSGWHITSSERLNRNLSPKRAACLNCSCCHAVTSNSSDSAWRIASARSMSSDPFPEFRGRQWATSLLVGALLLGGCFLLILLVSFKRSTPFQGVPMGRGIMNSPHLCAPSFAALGQDAEHPTCLPCYPVPFSSLTNSACCFTTSRKSALISGQPGLLHLNPHQAGWGPRL